MGSRSPENKSMTTRFARINPALLYKKKVVIPVNKFSSVLMKKLNKIEMANKPQTPKSQVNCIGKTK